MQRPMKDMLKHTSKRLSLHMPAAQGRSPFGRLSPYLYDTTELPITDDLYQPMGAIEKAQTLAAKSAGAAHTLLLHGGSTAGIHAMLLYSARRGETVILPRNAHVSALHICAVAGLECVFAEPSYTTSGRPYTEVAAYQKAMAAHPEAKAVLVLRPDYYGLMPELTAIAHAARLHHMLLLCDEAHGATFPWRNDVDSACTCGADLVVQSAHKTLPALTAGAWLHSAEHIDARRLRDTLRMVQTSSPSFVGMLSLDDARAWMDRYGLNACSRLRENLRTFLDRVQKLGYTNGQDDAPQGFSYDSLRLVLRAPQGGHALERALRLRGIDVEMCDAEVIVAIVSLMDSETRLKKLYRTLRGIERERHGAQKSVKAATLNEAESTAGGHAPEPASLLPPRDLPKRALSMSEAAFAPCELVPLAEAAGRVSAMPVGLYPPGVAMLTAGEIISEGMVKFMLGTEDARMFGLPKARHLLCVKP